MFIRTEASLGVSEPSMSLKVERRKRKRRKKERKRGEEERGEGRRGGKRSDRGRRQSRVRSGIIKEKTHQERECYQEQMVVFRKV